MSCGVIAETAGQRGVDNVHLTRRNEPASEIGRDDRQVDTQIAPAQEPQHAQLDAEKQRVERLGRVRQLVFGSLDGLLVPLGVISGVAGGTGSSRAVLVAGLAEAFAGALSMGAGEFIAARSEAQVQQSEVGKERDGIHQDPAFEQREMVMLLEREGVTSEDAMHIAAVLVRYPRSFHKTMVEKELGLQSESSTVKPGLTCSSHWVNGATPYTCSSPLRCARLPGSLHAAVGSR
jgi:hypothetical protein